MTKGERQIVSNPWKQHLELSLEEIADRLSLPYFGDPTYRLDGIASIENAEPNQLSFVVGKKYADELAATRAGVVILPEAMRNGFAGNAIVSPDPYLSYAYVSHIFYPPSPGFDGIHPAATVDPEAKVDPTASIAAGVVIERGARIEAGCVIGAGSVIGENARIGARTRLFANVTVYHSCELGIDCRVQSGTVIGGEGFGYAREGEGWQRINQIGRVMIGDRVEIGANTAIDRGAIGDTVIEDGVILDNLIQIAHNVRIGRNTAIAGCTGIAGSTSIGANCTIGGSTDIAGHLTIVDNVHFTGTAFVIKSVSEPGVYSSGMPAEKNSTWRRTVARLGQLDAMAVKLRRLGK